MSRQLAATLALVTAKAIGKSVAMPEMKVGCVYELGRGHHITNPNNLYKGKPANHYKLPSIYIVRYPLYG